MRFCTKLLQAGGTATGMVVPDKVVVELGAGKRPPVRVTINGYTYRNTVAVMGRKFMIGVSAQQLAIEYFREETRCFARDSAGAAPPVLPTRKRRTKVRVWLNRHQQLAIEYLR